MADSLYKTIMLLWTIFMGNRLFVIIDFFRNSRLPARMYFGTGRLRNTMTGLARLSPTAQSCKQFFGKFPITRLWIAFLKMFEPRKEMKKSFTLPTRYVYNFERESDKNENIFSFLSRTREGIICFAYNFGRSLIFTLFFLAGQVSFGGVLFAAEDLVIPTIAVYPNTYFPLDEVLYLEGRAQPQSSVQIYFQKYGSKPVRLNVRSDENGEWVLAQKVLLDSGDWEVRARMVKSSGEISGWSNQRVFEAVVSGITIGSVSIKFTILSSALVILIIVIAFLVWYFVFRIRRLNTQLFMKEVREAKDTLSVGLSGLRKDILDELRILESRGGPLSAEDLSRKEHLLRELDRVKIQVEREIEDIENVGKRL